MLRQVLDDRQRDVGLHDRGRERHRPKLLAHARTDVVALHVQDPREADVEPGLLGVRLRQLVRRDLDDVRGAAVDQRVAVAIDDLPARRGQLDRAHAVVVRLREIVVSGQHLQVPEAEEDDREHDERDAAEDCDAQGQARAHCGAAPI